MDVNALYKDELEFELACRGVVDCKTVATMRKFLRVMLRREASGESSISFKVPKSCIDEPSNEIDICRNKLSSLVTLISEISQHPDRSILKRIHSRLTHLTNRTKLIIPTVTADIDKHLALLKNIQDAMGSLSSLEPKDYEEDDVISEHDSDMLQKSLGEEAAKILENLGISHSMVKEVTVDNIHLQPVEEVPIQSEALVAHPVLPAVAGSSVDPGNVRLQWGTDAQGVIKPSSHRQGLQRTSTVDQDFYKRKLVPVKDWGVKFSGRGSVSINAFLERVEELKDARNADDDDLFRYAIDLFEEEALIWFRANKSTVSSWSALVGLLLDTFQQPNYQEELLEEIRQRTQSKQENVAIYVSIMQNMFNRLPVPLSEAQKLIIVRKNLQPYFQKEICRETFKSVGELTSVLRVIEHTKVRCESFREPSQSYCLLERDLAFQGRSIDRAQHARPEQNEVAAIEGGGAAGSKCWNCRSPGHLFRDCNLSRQRLFCYKCGRFGVTVQNCSCNNSSKGNDHSGSMPANQTPRD